MEIGKLKDPDLLSKRQIEQLLPLLDELIDWAGKVQEYALRQALAGEEYEGYKVVEGRTRRTIEDEAKTVAALTAAGYPEEMLYERRLQTLSKLEALVGKKKFKEIAGRYITTPAGKPTLVPTDDPREPFNTSAADDFNDGFADNQK